MTMMTRKIVRKVQEDNSVRCMAIERPESWADALALMDRQPWHKLVPIYAHPELEERVWKAYEQRWESVGHKNEPEREHWLEVCGDGLQQIGCFPNQTLDEIRREIIARIPRHYDRGVGGIGVVSTIGLET